MRPGRPRRGVALRRPDGHRRPIANRRSHHTAPQDPPRCEGGARAWRLVPGCRDGRAGRQRRARERGAVPRVQLPDTGRGGGSDGWVEPRDEQPRRVARVDSCSQGGSLSAAATRHAAAGRTVSAGGLDLFRATADDDLRGDALAIRDRHDGHRVMARTRCAGLSAPRPTANAHPTTFDDVCHDFARSTGNLGRSARAPSNQSRWFLPRMLRARPSIRRGGVLRSRRTRVPATRHGSQRRPVAQSTSTPPTSPSTMRPRHSSPPSAVASRATRRSAARRA